MTPSLSDAISDCFPNNSYSEILDIVESFGRGRTHARSVHLYDCAIRSASSSLDTLSQIVLVAKDRPDLFNDYCTRWQSWMQTAERYDRHEPTTFLCHLMRQVAAIVCWHRFDHGTSHSTLCVRSDAQTIDAVELFIKPLPQNTVCISNDPTDYFDPNFSCGTFATGDDAVLTVSSEIQRLYPRFA